MKKKVMIKKYAIDYKSRDISFIKFKQRRNSIIYRVTYKLLHFFLLSVCFYLFHYTKKASFCTSIFFFYTTTISN